jgi:poly(3-hydroxyalkanoate) synthetase
LHHPQRSADATKLYSEDRRKPKRNLADLTHDRHTVLFGVLEPVVVYINAGKTGAGHGPGIGGMKHDSEIGVALRAGHPCYFVGFLPKPEEGQTIEDVCRAEAEFVRAVAERHRNADGKPVLIGNCQAGWQIMMMAAMEPDLPGPILIAGTPLSYWAGVRGKYPMRYLGGLLGGTWLTWLMGDLGNGVFDGAWLVANFESNNPANTFWKKLYNVYANVDTEAKRFLDFEKWWGNPVLLNAKEMDSIVDELFVGNRLSSGKIVSSDGARVDLRKIRSPIASHHHG